jgi:hypothetical protein
MRSARTAELTSEVGEDPQDLLDLSLRPSLASKCAGTFAVRFTKDKERE